MRSRAPPESLAGDRPLTFFEHHFRCGNSLLGTWLERLNPAGEDGASAYTPDLFADAAQESVQQAAAARRLISGADSRALQHEGIDPESIEELRFKERQLKEAERVLEGARWLCDLRAADAFLGGKIGREWTTISSRTGDPKRLAEFVQARQWFADFDRIRRRERFFHWELEFPEVFLDREHPGFDAILGNPPWEKVKPDKKEFYAQYDVLIRQYKGAAMEKRIEEIQASRPGLDREFDIYADRLRLIASQPQARW